jgi:hypothetical protein
MNPAHLGTAHQVRRLAVLSAELALASDRWFLLALAGADSGARWLKCQALRLGEQPARLWARLLPGRSARQRLLALLRAEARRARYDVSQPAFQLFSERIAALLELVFSGAVAIDDIAFEAAESAEVGEEVTDDPHGDQGHEEQALRVQEQGRFAGPVRGREVAQRGAD